jgi:hypothetical protein
MERRKQVCAYLQQNLRETLRLVRDPLVPLDFVTAGGYTITELAHRFLQNSYTHKRKRTRTANEE